MNRYKSFIIFVLLLAAVGCSANGSADSSAAYTGFLEGDKVDVSAEVGGRLVTVAVEEGQTIQPGQPLATIQDDLVRARIAAADANLAAAQAQLALLQAGARPEDLTRAQARVDQAKAALDAAAQAVTDAEAIRANPQALVVAQAQADTRAKVAAQQLVAASAQAQAADAMNQFWEQQVRSLWDGVNVTLPQGGGTLHADIGSAKVQPALAEWSKAGTAAWQAWAGVQQAQANLNAANSGLKDITDQVKNPIAIDAKVSQARSAKDRAAAALELAQAGLQAVKDGASPAQIQAARAAVDQAKAARATLDQELAHYTVKAPQGGTVNQVYYRAGEMALPGAPLVRLTVDGDLTLRVFVPMSALDRIRVGTAAPVTVEGLEGIVPQGTVTHINNTAEFAARQVQTDSERNAQLVGVDLLIKNADGTFKAGMPASVTFK